MHIRLSVLYGCETQDLMLSEAFRLCVFENRVIGRIYEPKRKFRKLEKTA
jgi:hypothetical protein